MLIFSFPHRVEYILEAARNVFRVSRSAGARGHAHGAHDGGRVHRAAAGPHGGRRARARRRRARARALLPAAAAHAAQVLHLPVADCQCKYPHPHTQPRPALT